MMLPMTSITLLLPKSFVVPKKLGLQPKSSLAADDPFADRAHLGADTSAAVVELRPRLLPSDYPVPAFAAHPGH